MHASNLTISDTDFGHPGPADHEYAGLVIEVSEAGKRLLAEIVQDRMNGPQACMTHGPLGRSPIETLAP